MLPENAQRGVSPTLVVAVVVPVFCVLLMAYSFVLYCWAHELGWRAGLAAGKSEPTPAAKKAPAEKPEQLKKPVKHVEEGRWQRPAPSDD